MKDLTWVATDTEPNSPELDRRDILTTLVEAYEQQHYPIDAPDPI